MKDQLPLGRENRRWFPRTITLRREEIGHHTHVIGVSGSGKSFWLAHYVRELYRLGIGFTVIDPHGELTELILSLLGTEPDVKSRLTYIDPADGLAHNAYLPLNVLTQDGTPTRVADNVLDAMHRAWPALAGGSAPRFDKLVKNAVMALSEAGLTLPYLFKFLTDFGFRGNVVRQVSDPDVRDLWWGWYDKLPDRLRLDYADSTLSRVNILVSDEVLKHSLGQRQLSLDLSTQMNGSRAMLVNLDGLSANSQGLLGSLFTVMMEQAAFSRGTGRPLHVLVMDEFAQFAAQSEVALSTILSQLRKYNLFLVMAHQSWTQTSARLAGAMGNAKLKVAFQLQYTDAERSVVEFTRVDPRQVSVRAEAETVGVGMREQYTEKIQELMDLPPRHAYVRLPGGAVERIVTMDVAKPHVDIDELKRYYREKLFRPPPPRIEPASPVRRQRVL